VNNVEKETVIFEEELYNKFLASHFYSVETDKNKYHRFQKAVCPTYDELFTEKKTPEHVIYTTGLSLISHNDHYAEKNSHVETIVLSLGEGFTNEHFKEFIRFYLDVNLHGFTAKINKELRGLKEDIVIDDRVLNEAFKTHCYALEANVFSLESIKVLLEQLTSGFDDILLKKFTVDPKKN